MSLYATIYVYSAAFALGIFLCYYTISESMSRKDSEATFFIGAFLPVINIIQSAVLCFLLCCYFYSFLLDEIEDHRK